MLVYKRERAHDFHDDCILVGKEENNYVTDTIISYPDKFYEESQVGYRIGVWVVVKTFRKQCERRPL